MGRMLRLVLLPSCGTSPEGGGGTALYGLYILVIWLKSMYIYCIRLQINKHVCLSIGMCSPKGYGFSAVLVINRVSILADFAHFGRK